MRQDTTLVTTQHLALGYVRCERRLPEELTHIRSDSSHVSAASLARAALRAPDWAPQLEIQGVRQHHRANDALQGLQEGDWPLMSSYVEPR